jgi:hypothetical protein
MRDTPNATQQTRAAFICARSFLLAILSIEMNAVYTGVKDSRCFSHTKRDCDTIRKKEEKRNIKSFLGHVWLARENIEEE